MISVVGRRTSTNNAEVGVLTTTSEDIKAYEMCIAWQQKKIPGKLSPIWALPCTWKPNFPWNLFLQNKSRLLITLERCFWEPEPTATSDTLALLEAGIYFPLT